MIEFIRQVLGVAYLQSIFVKRQPLWIVQGLISAIGFTIIICVWGSIEALKNLVVAYIVAGAWGLGLNIVAQSIGWDRINRRLEYYVASPVTLPIYFIGTVLGCSPFMISSIVPALVAAIVFGVSPLPLFLLLPLSILALVLGAFFSLSIVLRLKNPTNISAITNPLYTFTIVLPPVYYPLYALPLVLRPIALLIPTVPLMEVARWITGYTATACEPQLSLILLVAWIIITTLVVAKKFKWGLE